MRRWCLSIVFLAASVVLGASADRADRAGPSSPAQAASSADSGWTLLPPDAAARKSPLTVDDKVIAAGKTVFKNKCQRCHGPAGRGDGPDADPDRQQDMDLTNSKRASRNADGVVFYKVMNGRKKPKMPAFKEELTEQQVWSVVAYVQTLRK